MVPFQKQWQTPTAGQIAQTPSPSISGRASSTGGVGPSALPASAMNTSQGGYDGVGNNASSPNFPTNSARVPPPPTSHAELGAHPNLSTTIRNPHPSATLPQQTWDPKQPWPMPGAVAPTLGAPALQDGVAPSSTTLPGPLMEQRIFPGIVHARVRRNSNLQEFDTIESSGVTRTGDEDDTISEEKSSNDEHSNGADIEDNDSPQFEEPPPTWTRFEDHDDD